MHVKSTTALPSSAVRAFFRKQEGLILIEKPRILKKINDKEVKKSLLFSLMEYKDCVNSLAFNVPKARIESSKKVKIKIEDT